MGKQDKLFIIYRTLNIIQKNEFLKALKNMKYKDVDDMVFRMNLTNNEKEYSLDKKYISAENKSFSFHYGKYEIRELKYETYVNQCNSPGRVARGNCGWAKAYRPRP